MSHYRIILAKIWERQPNQNSIACYIEDCIETKPTNLKKRKQI